VRAVLSACHKINWLNAAATLGELAKHSALDLVRFSRSLHDGRLKGTLVGQRAQPVTYRKWWAREAKDLWVWA
jgi:hypothetical protein